MSIGSRILFFMNFSDVPNCGALTKSLQIILCQPTAHQKLCDALTCSSRRLTCVNKPELVVHKKPSFRIRSSSNRWGRGRFAWVKPPYHFYASIKFVRPASFRLCVDVVSPEVVRRTSAYAHFPLRCRIAADMYNIIIIINGIFSTQSNFKCKIFGCRSPMTTASLRFVCRIFYFVSNSRIFPVCAAGGGAWG